MSARPGCAARRGAVAKRFAPAGGGAEAARLVGQVVLSLNMARQDGTRRPAQGRADPGGRSHAWVSEGSA